MRERIVALIENLFFVDREFNLEDSQSLMESGVVDSLGMMELVKEVEKSFGIKVDIDELSPENFDSVSGLIRFVESRL